MSNEKRLGREELYEMVWSTPLSKLAPNFGLSDKGLAKKCTKHKIPTPSLGYWAKVKSGKKALKVRLPKLKDQEHDLQLVSFSPPKEMNPILKKVKTKSVIKKIPSPHLTLSNNDEKEIFIRKYHPILEANRKIADTPSIYDQYSRVSFVGDAPRIGLKITKGTFERTFIFLERLVRTLKLINIDLTAVHEDFKKHKVAVFQFNDFTISFEVREKLKRFENKPPENKRGGYEPWYQKYDYQPSGNLEFELIGYFHGLRTCWRDTTTKSLEKQINVISAAIEEAFEVKRLAQIEAQNKAKREKIEQAEIAQREQIELVIKHQQFHLEKLARDFERAERIRNFLSALTESSKGLSEMKQWLDWATNYAEFLDPLNEPQSIIAMHTRLCELDKYQLNSLKW